MAKVDRKRLKAEKAAQAEAKKAAQNTKKTLQTAQSGKHKASQASSPKSKCQKQSGGVAARLSFPEAVLATPPKVNSRGRAITFHLNIHNTSCTIDLLQSLHQKILQ
jgi:hypothetical protein